MDMSIQYRIKSIALTITYFNFFKEKKFKPLFMQTYLNPSLNKHKDFLI